MNTYVPWVRRHRKGITAGPGEPRLDDIQGLRMGKKHIIGIGVVAAVSLALGCGVFVSPASAQSLGDRFKSLFGGKPDEPAQAAPPSAPADGQTDLSCPPVSIRPGASTFAVAAPRKHAL